MIKNFSLLSSTGKGFARGTLVGGSSSVLNSALNGEKNVKEETLKSALIHGIATAGVAGGIYQGGKLLNKVKRNYVFSYMSKIANFNSDEEETNSNIPLGLLQAGSGLYLGQQTIRSGIPRALGVRLESHSTSHNNAKDILDNGGILDPNKSGKGAMSALDVAVRHADVESDIPENFKTRGVTELADRRKDSIGKVFITGIHPDKTLSEIELNAIQQQSGIRPDKPITQSIYKQAQRVGYRSQQELNINPSKYNHVFAYIRDRDAEIKANNSNPFNNHVKGRSLYVGGSDNYFRDNFVADVDDAASMMTTNRVKVSGNRLGAVKDAIQREGLVNLIRANPKRVAAGAGILLGGGLLTTNALKGAYSNLIGNREDNPS